MNPTKDITLVWFAVFAWVTPYQQSASQPAAYPVDPDIPWAAPFHAAKHRYSTRRTVR